MQPVLDVHRPRTRRIAAAVWVALLVGALVLSRVVSRGADEPLFPVTVVIGAGVGVVVSTAGCVRYLRRISETSAVGRVPSPTIPRHVRRDVLRLGPVPEPFRDRVPVWLDARRAAVRLAPALMACFFGQAMAVSSMQDVGWWGPAVAAAGWGVLALVLGGCAALYRRRIERAQRHFRDLATT